MKILLVSMASLHFFRWTEQLQESGHEIYWFDVLDNGQPSERIPWVHQIVRWKLRWDFPGRYFVKNKLPKIYKVIQKVNERNVTHEFEKKLIEIQPDVVHSFALYISCTPIFEVMKKHKSIKWIYSSWGSDLYDLQNHSDHLKDIKNVLARVNYLFTDCKRDYEIALKHGFKNEFLGVLPGGGGYHLNKMKTKITPIDSKSIILIKGFQGKWGRAINVLKAIIEIQEQLRPFKIIVFGADEDVFKFVEKSNLSIWVNFEILGMIEQEELINLMGNSILYIGNSKSDGIPNTMIEAMCMNAFPIQSNPGGATQELITNGLNGLLIEDSENIENIRNTILQAINNREMIKSAIQFNSLNLVPSFDYDFIKNGVLKSYLRVLNDD